MYISIQNQTNCGSRAIGLGSGLFMSNIVHPRPNFRQEAHWYTHTAADLTARPPGAPICPGANQGKAQFTLIPAILNPRHLQPHRTLSWTCQALVAVRAAAVISSWMQASMRMHVLMSSSHAPRAGHHKPSSPAWPMRCYTRCSHNGGVSVGPPCLISFHFYHCSQLFQCM